MKFLFSLVFLLLFNNSKGQYALLDKGMYTPVTYSGVFTIQDEYHNLFPVEKNNLKDFLNALEKVRTIILKNNYPASINIKVGKTTFYGLRLVKAKEERMDVVITTECGNRKIKMHLCDENVSNSSNAYFIKSWEDYINESLKAK